MMKEQQTEPRLQQLGRALRSQIADTLTCDLCQALLPGYLQAESEGGERSRGDQRFVAVRNHLALCPHCTAAYQQMGEWLTASVSDVIAPSAAYPAFDLSFLQPPAVSSASTPWPLELLQKSRQQGEQWLRQTLGGLYLIFTPAPALAGAGWAVKSGGEDMLLARTMLSEDDLPGWEIEATVFAIGEEECRVEVSLYAFEPRQGDLAGIAVTLHDGVNERLAFSDVNGLVVFNRVRRGLIEALVVRVALPAG